MLLTGLADRPVALLMPLQFAALSDLPVTVAFMEASEFSFFSFLIWKLKDGPVRSC